MKKLSALFLLTMILMNPGFAQRGWEMCSHRKSNIPQMKLQQLLSPNSPNHTFDVLNYSLDLNLYNCFISPYPNSFSGSVTLTFRVDTALNTITLNAYKTSLVIDSVRLAGVSFVHGTNHILTITLDQTYQPGSIVSVRIYYRHLDVTDDHFYASNGFVFTDCEPEGARCWFPCWDKPSDKATMEMTARVPTNVKLASNGRLQDSTVAGSALYYHWVSRDPVATYLMIITAKVNYKLDIVPWPKLSNPNDTIPFRFYYNNGEDPTDIKSIIGPMCNWFSQSFCDMPFEKNGFATLNNQFVWGGMENQTLTSLCPGCWSEGLVAHEFAHQWFGDMITCGTWADIFVNEAFATWGEAFWYEGSQGYTAYKDEIINDAQNYLSGNPGWPIYNPSWAVTTPPTNQLFNTAITYTKGACVLHMLRYVMGDSLFFLGLRNYCNDTINFKFDNSTIQDFSDLMSATYGQSLQWFFDEWTKFPDHPFYQNTYNIMNVGSNEWRVRFFAKQTQTNTTFFKMPIQIRVRFIDNSNTILNVMNDVNNQLYEFFFNKQPVQVYFDPNNDIVLKQGNTTVGFGENIIAPEIFSLGQNQPNPVSSSTSIHYAVPAECDVQLYLHDVTGKLVRILDSGQKAPGNYEVSIDLAGLSPGMYFYMLKAGDFVQTRKMVVE